MVVSHWGFALLKHVIWVTPSILICQRFSPENSFFCSHLRTAFNLFVIAARATIYCTLYAMPTFLWFFLSLFFFSLHCFTLRELFRCDKSGFMSTGTIIPILFTPFFVGHLSPLGFIRPHFFALSFPFFRFHSTKPFYFFLHCPFLSPHFVRLFLIIFWWLCFWFPQFFFAFFLIVEAHVSSQTLTVHWFSL